MYRYNRDSYQIKRFLEEREIQHLYHFTRLENLDNICNMGLLSVDRLEENNIECYRNDAYRLDGATNTISLSIEFPNYKMLYSYRMNSDSKWIIISLSPALLYELECLFCRHNAASNEITNEERSNLYGIKGLRSMFSDTMIYRGIQKMRREGLPSYYTTDPLAEVLVRDSISPKYIEEIRFESYEDFDENKSICQDNGIKCLYEGVNYKGSKLFSPRIDYDDWRY